MQFDKDRRLWVTYASIVRVEKHPEDGGSRCFSATSEITTLQGVTFTGTFVAVRSDDIKNYILVLLKK